MAGPLRGKKSSVLIQTILVLFVLVQATWAVIHEKHLIQFVCYKLRPSEHRQKTVSWHVFWDLWCNQLWQWLEEGSHKKKKNKKKSAWSLICVFNISLFVLTYGGFKKNLCLKYSHRHLMSPSPSCRCNLQPSQKGWRLCKLSILTHQAPTTEALWGMSIMETILQDTEQSASMPKQNCSI